MPQKGKCTIFSARVCLAILCATGVMELYMSRTNLSIAIVDMVEIVRSGEDATNLTQNEPYCKNKDVGGTYNSSIQYNQSSSYETFNDSYPAEENDVNGPVLTLTTTQRGNALSAFFYAYGISGIFGGRMADVYGTKKVFGMAVLVDAIGNMLIPVASKTSYWLLFSIRFIMGLFQGTCYPSLHSLISRWIPPHEMSRFTGFVYYSSTFGTMFSLTVCGVITNDLGWQYVFYICGGISLFWLVFWVLLMYDNPEDHPRISPEEKEYILRSLECTRTSDQKKRQRVPWLKIVSSVPIWAICVAHGANMFALNFFITQIPIYMGSVVGVNIRSNGILSSIPFLGRFMGSNGSGWLFSFLASKTTVGKKTWKIIITTLAFGGTAVPLVCVGYTGCREAAILSLLFVSLTFNGFSSAGYICNHVDLTPNFSGTAFGLTNTIAFLYAMTCPVISGALTPNETLGEWITVFWYVFCNFLAGGIFYCTLVSTEVQPWNEEGLDDDKANASDEKISSLQQRLTENTDSELSHDNLKNAKQEN